MSKEVKVKPIDNGIVIDHIPAGRALSVAKILCLETNQVTLGMNVRSKKLGIKDYLKIEDRELTSYEINKISIIAPFATVSFITDGKVDTKIKVKLPDNLLNIVKCGNPNCITRFEKITTNFSVVNKSPVQIRCAYCERISEEDEIELL